MTSKSTTTRRRARAVIAGAATTAATPAIAAGDPDAELKRLRDELECRDREHEVAFDAFCDAEDNHQHDTAALEAARDAAFDAYHRAVDRFLTAPAHTPRGALLKLAWAIDGELDASASIHPEVRAIAAAIDDLQRIAGQGGDRRTLEEIEQKLAELEKWPAYAGLLETVARLNEHEGGPIDSRIKEKLRDLRDGLAGEYADLVVLVQQARQQLAD